MPNPIAMGQPVPQNNSYDVSQSSQYGDLINHYKSDIQTPWKWNPNEQNISGYTGQINQIANQFSSQFQNLVGRAPTEDETNHFVQNFVIPNTNNIGNGTNNSAFVGNMPGQLQQFIGQNYQQAAQDYASQQLTAQQGQANSLADLFRSQGNSAISETENSLLDYQSKLFDRLRPNLITSLQSQGLLNTGGMNEAIAGAQGDLANSASQYIAGLKYQNEQGANQIAFGGAAAPYYYDQGNITNNPANMMAAGNTAMNQNYGTFMQQLQYQNQLGMINAQARAQQGLQPSFMHTFSQNLAQGLGTNASLFTGPGAFAQSGSGGQAGVSGFQGLKAAL